MTDHRIFNDTHDKIGTFERVGFGHAQRGQKRLNFPSNQASTRKTRHASGHCFLACDGRKELRYGMREKWRFSHASTWWDIKIHKTGLTASYLALCADDTGLGCEQEDIRSTKNWQRHTASVV